MALQLGQLGRTRALSALSGKSLVPQQIFLALYFAQDSGGNNISIGINTDLSDLVAWEILPTTGGGETYVRPRVDLSMGSVNPVTSALYGEVTNTGVFDISIAGNLSQTPTATNPVGYAVLTTLQVGVGTSSPDEVLAYGPLSTPITNWVFGDSIRVTAGALQIRQS